AFAVLMHGSEIPGRITEEHDAVHSALLERVEAPGRGCAGASLGVMPIRAVLRDIDTALSGGRPPDPRPGLCRG
ncbi:hypothetical protein ABZ729_37455, partial [Streptomyces sp. NPDC006678]